MWKGLENYKQTLIDTHLCNICKTSFLAVLNTGCLCIPVLLLKLYWFIMLFEEYLRYKTWPWNYGNFTQARFFFFLMSHKAVMNPTSVFVALIFVIMANCHKTSSKKKISSRAKWPCLEWHLSSAGGFVAPWRGVVQEGLKSVGNHGLACACIAWVDQPSACWYFHSFWPEFWWRTAERSNPECARSSTKHLTENQSEA